MLSIVELPDDVLLALLGWVADPVGLARASCVSR